MIKETNPNIKCKKYSSKGFSNLVYFNWALLVFWVCFLGVQIDLQILPFRFAPSDFFMFLFWILNISNREVNFNSFISVDLLLILLILTISGSIALFKAQTFLAYTIINKYIGLIVLIFDFFFITNIIKDSELMFQRTLNVFVLSGGILNIIYIVFSFVFPISSSLKNILLYGSNRLRGLLIDPNAYGGFLVTIFFLSLSLFIKEKIKKEKVIYSMICITIFISIILTFSRSALLGFFVGLTVAILFYKEIRKYFFVTLCILLPCIIFYYNKTETFNDIVLFLLRSNTIRARFDFIVTGLELFSKSPIFGIGLGSYFALTGVIIHNTFIWILVEMGVIGLLVFVFFIFHILQTNIRLIKKFEKSHKDLFYITIGLFCAIISLCVYGIGIEFLYQRHLWLLFALLQAVLVIHKKEVSVNA